MIDEYRAKKYCCEDLSLIENYELAIADTTKTWQCHHRAEILPCGIYRVKHLKLFRLYYHRPASELVFLTEADHKHIHSYGKSHYLFGKHHSEEAKKKMSEAKKGKHLSEAHRLSISMSNKGREVSLKTRIKISNANKRKSHEYSWSKVQQYTLTNKLITEYPSIGVAAEATGVRYQNISACCRGITKSAGGFVWRYV